MLLAHIFFHVLDPLFKVLDLDLHSIPTTVRLVSWVSRGDLFLTIGGSTMRKSSTVAVVDLVLEITAASSHRIFG